MHSGSYHNNARRDFISTVGLHTTQKGIWLCNFRSWPNTQTKRKCSTEGEQQQVPGFSPVQVIVGLVKILRCESCLHTYRKSSNIHKYLVVHIHLPFLFSALHNHFICTIFQEWIIKHTYGRWIHFFSSFCHILRRHDCLSSPPFCSSHRCSLLCSFKCKSILGFENCNSIQLSSFGNFLVLLNFSFIPRETGQRRNSISYSFA